MIELGYRVLCKDYPEVRKDKFFMTNDLGQGDSGYP